MADKFILIIRDGRLTSRTLRSGTRIGLRREAWLAKGAALAHNWKAERFVMRLEGYWHVCTSSGTVLKRFPAANGKAAAEMYLRST